MLIKALPEQTIQYLNQVFGEGAVRIASEKSVPELPYFLQDAYEILPCELLGYSVALACVKSLQPRAARQLSQHAERLREVLETPVIVALPEITPGERKQLIQQGIAFVVPGRQLFAPQMGLILSERFAAVPQRGLTVASPATQALLIRFLNDQQRAETWHPFEQAAKLGYTAMTATRAVRELLQFNLFALEARGRAKHLKLLSATRRELWEKAKPHLRSPVQRTLWTYDQHILELTDACWAGESALARMTMLDAPPQAAVALTTEVAQQAKQNGIVFEPRELADGIAVQVWRYAPDLEAHNKTVDSLSLWLSLRDKQDDRIQIALDELEEQFPW